MYDNETLSTSLGHIEPKTSIIVLMRLHLECNYTTNPSKALRYAGFFAQMIVDMKYVYGYAYELQDSEALPWCLNTRLPAPMR